VSKLRVLLALASPQGEEKLSLLAELRKVFEAKRRFRQREIEETVLPAATIKDLRRALLEGSYDIVHISTHGNPVGYLIFDDEDGKRVPVPPQALAELFGAYSPPIDCVILNGCDSQLMGELTSMGVPFTIAMEGPLDDEAGIKFSEGFYDATAAGKSRREAFDEGVRAVRTSRGAPGFEFNPLFLENEAKIAEARAPEPARGSMADLRRRVRARCRSLAADLWGILARQPVWLVLLLAGGAVAAVAAVSLLIRPQPGGGDVTGIRLGVVPFKPASAQDQGFANGFSQELITTLGSISNFTVPGPTASLRINNKDAYADIARALGVTYLVDGSVQQDGSRLRVRAQLVVPETGFIRWTHTYDGELSSRGDNIVEVENDIAQQVIAQLQGQLLPAHTAVLSRPGTSDGEAHRLYLIGTNLLRIRTLDSTRSAKETFERAIARDANYADAYAGLAQAYALLMGNFQLELEQGAFLGEQAVAKALSLDRNSGMGLVARVALEHLRYVTADDVSAEGAAIVDIKRAIDVLPANVADAKHWYGFTFMYDRPDFDRADKSLADALESDSGFRMAQLNTSTVRWWRGAADKAADQFKEIIAISPDYPFSYLFLSWLNLSQGHVAEAVRVMDSAEKAAKDPSFAYRRWQLRMDLGDTEGARAALKDFGGDQFHDTLRKGAELAMNKNYKGELALLEDAKRRGIGDGRLDYAIASLAHFLRSPRDAAQVLERRYPAIVSGKDVINFVNADAAIELAAAWTAVGRAAEAQELLGRISAYLDGPMVPRVSHINYWRAAVHAIQGQHDVALDDLNRAYQEGFRMVWFDREVRPWFLQFVPLPIDNDPRFASLQGDAHYRNWLTRIKADNARQLISVQDR